MDAQLSCAGAYDPLVLVMLRKKLNHTFDSGHDRSLLIQVLECSHLSITLDRLEAPGAFSA